MRRESSEEVTAAAHRRLEQLGRELGRRSPGAGDEQELAEEEPEEIPAVRPVLVPSPGRHARGPAGAVDTLRDRFRDRLPRTSLLPAHLPVLGVLVVLVLAITVWFTMRSGAEPVPVARTSPSATSTAALPASPSTATAAASSSPSPTSSAQVVVDVAGKVLRPGVLTLPAGSRVVDALRQAGGARRGVDVSGLNLARVLVDGEQILVGKPGAAAAAAAPGGGPAGAAGQPAGAGVPVNLNTADLAALDALPGVGPVTAQKILDWRAKNGSFSSVDQLLEVPGIGPKTLADLTPHVTV